MQTRTLAQNHRSRGATPIHAGAPFLLLALLLTAGPARGQTTAGAHPVGSTHVFGAPLETPHPYPAGGGTSTPVWSTVIDVAGLGCTGCSSSVPWTKLHFSRFELGYGDYVTVGVPGDPFFDLYDASEPDGLWAASVPGSAVAVALWAGAGSAEHGGSHGLEIDKVGYGFPDGFSIPSGLCDAYIWGDVCIGDPHDIICFPTEYPYAKPVCRVVFGFGDLCWYAVTGFVINDMGNVLTVEHAVNSTIDVLTAEAQFGYEVPIPALCDFPIAPAGYPLPELQAYRGERLLLSNYDCDLAVFTLIGGKQAARLWDWAWPAQVTPGLGQQVFMPQHPSAKAKKGDFGLVTDKGTLDIGGDPPKICSQGLFEYAVPTQGGAGGAPLFNSDHEVVGIHHSLAAAGQPECVGRGTMIEMIRYWASIFLADAGRISKHFLFEDERGDNLSSPEIEVGVSISSSFCTFSASTHHELSLDWSHIGRFPAEVTLRWDPARAVSGAGYAGCPPFQVAVSVRPYDDPKEHEVEFDLGFETAHDVTASACKVSKKWDIDFERSVGLESELTPPLGGANSQVYKSRIKLGSASFEIPFTDDLEFFGFAGKPGIGVQGHRIDGELWIADVKNLVPPHGGVSFTAGSNEVWCGEPDDKLETVQLLQEEALYVYDIYIKPCVLPGSEFKVVYDPAQYVTDPSFSTGLEVEYRLFDKVKQLANLCPGCANVIPGNWNVPAAAGTEPLELVVRVREPTPGTCDGAQALMDAYCQQNPSDPHCTTSPGSPDPPLDLVLEFGEVGSLPPGKTMADAILPVDFGGDGLPDVLWETPSFDLVLPVPGTTALVNLGLRDVYAHLADPAFLAQHGTDSFAVDLRLFTPDGDPAGYALQLGAAQMSAISVANLGGQVQGSSGRVVLPDLGTLATLLDPVLQVEWFVPDHAEPAWGLNGHGKARCFPAARIEADLVQLSGTSVEFDANNSIEAHFTPGLPDFAFERLETLRDADIGTYPNDEHRWIEVGHTMTLEVDVRDRGSGSGSLGLIADVPVFMTVQYIDQQGVLPVHTDAASPVPVYLPPSGFDAGALQSVRFHYAPPPTAVVSPADYEWVVFTFTVNDIPACAQITGIAPCDCDVVGGSPTPCGCVVQPDATLHCGSLPVVWGGGPAVLLPECNRVDNVARITVEFVPAGTGDPPCPPSPSLTGTPPTISVATGGIHTLDIDEPSSPFLFYIVLGSISGTWPGLSLTPCVTVPLNYDAYFSLTAGGLGLVGMLDPAGVASVPLTIPSGLNPNFAGFTLHHACVLLDLGLGELRSASDPAPLTFVP